MTQLVKWISKYWSSSGTPRDCPLYQSLPLVGQNGREDLDFHWCTHKAAVCLEKKYYSPASVIWPKIIKYLSKTFGKYDDNLVIIDLFLYWFSRKSNFGYCKHHVPDPSLFLKMQAWASMNNSALKLKTDWNFK